MVQILTWICSTVTYFVLKSLDDATEIETEHCSLYSSPLWLHCSCRVESDNPVGDGMLLLFPRCAPLCPQIILPWLVLQRTECSAQVVAAMMGMHDWQSKEKDLVKRLTRRKTLGVRREQKLRKSRKDWWLQRFLWPCRVFLKGRNQ